MEGQENLEQGNGTEQENFDAVFNEAIGQQEAPVASNEEAPVVSNEESEGEGKDTNVESTDESSDIVDSSDYKALYEKELQRTKSWEGRISASERRNAELLRELQELREQVKKQDTFKQESLVDTDDPLIKNFIEEMGDDFIKPLDAYIQKKIKPLIDEAVKPFVEKVPVIEQTVETVNEARVQEHFAKILEAHPDVPELIKPDESGRTIIDEYVESLPYKEAIRAKEIIDKGSTKQVIDFLTEFKEKTGRLSNETTKVKKEVNTQVSKEKLAAATAVKGNTPIIPKSKADPNDFEGAWNEAVSIF